MFSIFRGPPSAVLQFFLVLGVASLLLAAQQQQPSAPSATIKSNVNEVLVPVVVRDGQGNAVGSLEIQNFQILDNGKPQVITGFAIIERPTEPSSTIASSLAPHGSPGATQPPSPTQRFVVLLFDDLNLSASDLKLAQNAATKLLEGTLPASDTAAVLSTSGTNSGLTRDRAKLQQAILAIKPNSVYRYDPQSCPKVNYYTADLILDKRDEMAIQAAVQDTISCANLPNDPVGAETAKRMVEQAAERAVAMGQQTYRTDLSFIRLVVSKLGALPGERILILISPGFLTPSGEAMELASQVLEMAARDNIIINAIDSRGLYTTNLESSERGGGSPLASRVQNENRPVSMTADEGVVADLADGSGGTYIHGHNDLESGLARLFLVPKYLYLLTFSVAKPNGAYHELKVKVNHDGLTVQARRGYVALKSESKK